MTFTERLHRRHVLWWAPLGSLRTPRGLLLAVYRRGFRRLRRGGELQIHRRRTDPERVWRFCRYWQRTLLNKFNSREFAQRHGCRVPALYWYGTDIAHMPIESFPDCFVIRPTLGSARQGVYVLAGDHDLMSGSPLPRKDLRDRLVSEFGEIASQAILVEEFVRSPLGDYALPIEYKFHAFSDRIAAIEAVQRTGRKERSDRHCDAHWKPLAERIHTQSPPGARLEPPDCIVEMMSCARRLGMAFGTYVRVDYYASDKGAVFSEFSSTPFAGKGYTPFADEYFGRLWREIYPRQV